MLIKKTVDRRTLLKGLGLAASAQLLPTLRPAYAANGKIPTRFVIFYTQHGTLPWLWSPLPKAGAPAPTQTDWEFNYLLTPLADYKKDITLLGGIDSKALDAGHTGECGHATGQMGSLTSNKQVAQKLAAGPSIDQFIAAELAKANGGNSPTLVPTSQLGIMDTAPNYSLWGQPYMAMKGDKVTALGVTSNPTTAYLQLFKNFNPGAADASLGKRKTVLDWVTKEYGKVGDVLGSAEKARLQAHADLVSSFQQRLTNAGGGGSAPSAACMTKPDANLFTTNKGSAGWWENTSTAMPKLMQLAFACDVTRIVALQVQEPPPRAFGYMPGQYGTTDLHDLVHKLDVDKKDTGNDPDRLGVAKAYYKVHADLFASVLKNLADLKEADGSRMLDHTVVLWCGEIAQPGHSYCNNKWLYAGSGGGYLKTGQFFGWDGDMSRGTGSPNVPSNGDLFVTIANAMGVPATTFGEPTACKGAISALKA